MLPVQPEPRKGLRRRTFTLGNLVLMMRKDEIDCAAVDIECFAEVLHCHCGALQMPAGPACPEGRFPLLLSGILWALPQHEIVRLLLFVFIGIDARSNFQLSAVESGETAIGWKT